MWPILFISIACLAIIIERIIFVIFRWNINGAKFMQQISKYVMSNRIDAAISFCDKRGKNKPLPYVIKMGLLHANRPEREIQDAVTEATLEVIPKLEKRTPYLHTFANVATLLGLLGTIAGLIQAFKAVGEASAEAKQTLLAKGIAIAMYTTAFGLIVASPTLFFAVIIEQQTKKITDEIDYYSVKLVNMLAKRRRASLKVVKAEEEG